MSAKELDGWKDATSFLEQSTKGRWSTTPGVPRTPLWAELLPSSPSANTFHSLILSACPDTPLLRKQGAFLWQPVNNQPRGPGGNKERDGAERTGNVPPTSAQKHLGAPQIPAAWFILKTSIQWTRFISNTVRQVKAVLDSGRYQSKN